MASQYLPEQLFLKIRYALMASATFEKSRFVVLSESHSIILSLH
jgi:hypothetical protein